MQTYFKSIILILCIFLVSCSRQVLRQSISEIERPLFLPKKNWQVSFGGLIGKRVKTEEDAFKHQISGTIDINNKTFWFPVLDLQWPSIHIGRRFEYYIPSIIRLYIAKNIEITDSIERISGINIAIVNGIYGFSYSTSGEFKLTTCHSLPVKAPLSEKIWIESNPGITLRFPPNKSINFDFYGQLSLPFGCGYQISESWSCKAAFNLVGHFDHFAIDPNESEYNKRWEYTKRTYDLDIHIPIETKYVFSHNWELSSMIAGAIYDSKNVDIQSALSISYTW